MSLADSKLLTADVTYPSLPTPKSAKQINIGFHQLWNLHYLVIWSSSVDNLKLMGVISRSWHSVSWRQHDVITHRTWLPGVDDSPQQVKVHPHSRITHTLPSPSYIWRGNSRWALFWVILIKPNASWNYRIMLSTCQFLRAAFNVNRKPSWETKTRCIWLKG